MKTVDWIQSQIASIVDQDNDTNNISTEDYALRLNYINRAQEEWAEITNWQSLYREYNVLGTASLASVTLPTDFRKLASYPKIAGDQYPEVLPQEDGKFSSTDKRVWILGDPNVGYTLRIFGVDVASGASIQVPYYASPASLVSSSDVSSIPNPQYLVQKTVAYIWEGREDPRFPQAKADADRILSNMIERENTPNYASDWSTVKTVEENKYDFRWGRD